MGTLIAWPIQQDTVKDNLWSNSIKDNLNNMQYELLNSLLNLNVVLITASKLDICM